MSCQRETFDASVLSGARSARPVLDCHECEVICERVVCPWKCLKEGRTCIYAFEEEGKTYFGCLHKVFAPEFDLSAFNGEGSGRGCRSDPYGPVRVVRAPRSQCPVSVERAYRVDSSEARCVNPAFLREAFDAGDDLESRGASRCQDHGDVVNG